MCRFRVESVNVFVLPRFDFCFINKQFRTCANTFPNEFTVRSYMNIGRVNIEFFPGWEKIKHCCISFVLGYLRTILWKISTAIYLYGFLNQSLGLILRNILFYYNNGLYAFKSNYIFWLFMSNQSYVLIKSFIEVLLCN